jgi:hypothetical protein
LEVVDWSNAAQDGDSSRAVVNTVKNVAFRAGEGIFRLVGDLLASQDGLCCVELLVNSSLDLKMLVCLF